jgi:hypothetical protein
MADDPRSPGLPTLAIGLPQLAPSVATVNLPEVPTPPPPLQPDDPDKIRERQEQIWAIEDEEYEEADWERWRLHCVKRDDIQIRKEKITRVVELAEGDEEERRKWVLDELEVMRRVIKEVEDEQRQGKAEQERRKAEKAARGR